MTSYTSKFFKSSTTASYISWICMVSFVVFQFFIQGMIGVISDPLKQSFALDSASLSLLSSSFYLTYLAMQIPVGLIYDRFGLKKASCTALAISILSLIWFSHSHTFYSLLLSRLTMGVSCAFGFVGMLISIQRLLPKSNFALYLALSECVAMWLVGLSNQITAYYAEIQGWRYCLTPIATFGTFNLLIFWLFGADTPTNPKKNPSLVKQFHKAELAGGIQPWVFISKVSMQSTYFLKKLHKTLKLPCVWAAGTFSGLTFSVISVFQALWILPFLEHVHHIPKVETTKIAGLLYLGVGVASPILGYLAEKIKVLSLIRFGVLSCFTLMTILFTQNGLSSQALNALLFALGFCSSTYQLGFVYVTREVAPELRGLASGATNMAMMLIAPLLQLITGTAISWLQNNKVFDGYEDVTGLSYQGALLILPCSLILALSLTAMVHDDQGEPLLHWIKSQLRWYYPTHRKSHPSKHTDRSPQA